MSVTLTYERARRRLALALGAAMTVMAGLSSATAQAPQPGGGFPFHSFVPGAPRLAPPAPEVRQRRAGEMRAARAAYEAGDYQATRHHLNAALKDGNTVAAWYLGHMYRLGRGVKKNPAKAFRYYRKVALAFDGDDPRPWRLRIGVDSLVRVADVYLKGLPKAGIKRQVRRAFALYNTAAEYRHPAAYFGLGKIYFLGLMGKPQRPQGWYWLKKAVRKHHGPALAFVGDLYWAQNKSGANRVQALKWYLLAQQSTAPGELPRISAKLDKILSRVSDGERQQAERLAAQWLQRNPGRPLVITPTAQ